MEIFAWRQQAIVEVIFENDDLVHLSGEITHSEMKRRQLPTLSFGAALLHVFLHNYI